MRWGTIFLIPRLAASFDERLDRRRGAVLVVGAIATHTSLHFAPNVYAWVLPSYALLVWALIAARLWNQRDEHGDWSLDVALHSASFAAADLVVGVAGFFDGAWTAALRKLGRFLMAIGVVAASVSYPAGVVAGEPSTAPSVFVRATFAASVTAGIGLVLWLAGWLIQRKERARFKALGPVAVASLPPLLDIRVHPVLASTSEGLRELLGALASWSPRLSRRRGHREADFERSLVRHLEKKLPRAEVRPQVVLRGKRPDLIFNGSVLIELKVSESGRELLGLMGQMANYARRWNGPLLVVNCEAGAGFAEADAMKNVEDLRRLGRDISVVLAGRSAGRG